MTDDFRNELRGAVSKVLENSFAKLYEENKKYVRTYERLVLEAVKSFNFNTQKFDETLLMTKTDLVGKTDKVHIFLDEEEKVGKIYLSYMTDNRFPEYKNYEKPNYIKEGTYCKEYMKYLLAEQGIEVSVRYADGCMTSDDTYTIKFDASLLVEALNNVNDQIKRRKREQ